MLRTFFVASLVVSCSSFSPSAPAALRVGRDSFLCSGRSTAHLLGRPAGARSGAIQTKAFFDFGSIFGGGDGGASVAERRAEKAQTLRKLCGTAPKNGVGASDALRASIQEACRELEALNPTKQQAWSPLLNGRWELLYTSTGGASAGKLGPFVGEVEQDINVKGNKYYNIVRLGGVVEAVLSAHWDVVGGEKWNVTFDDIKFSVFGLKVIDKEFASVGRDKTLSALDEAAENKKDRSTANAGTWEMTYTDENLRILNAQGSDPAKPPNVYILSRIAA